MTNIIKNLLKLTDYPFSYSIIGLPLANKFDLSNVNVLIPFIFLVSLLGTTLSITDPIGKSIRFGMQFLLLRSSSGFGHYLQKFIEDIKNKDVKIENIKNEKGIFSIFDTVKSYLFSISGKTMSTSWLTYEVDKLVSTIYFFIILIVIFILIQNNNTTVIQNFMIFNQNVTDSENLLSNNTTNDNIHLIKVLILFAIIGITIIILFELKKLYTNAVTVSTYFFSSEIIPDLVKISSTDFIQIIINRDKEHITAIEKDLEQMAKSSIQEDTDQRYRTIRELNDEIENLNNADINLKGLNQIVMELQNKSQILFNSIEKRDWALAQIYADLIRKKSLDVIKSYLSRKEISWRKW